MANQLAGRVTTAEPLPETTSLSPEDAMELVYRLHAKPLFRFLLRLTLGDRREAEDILQETLLRAWRDLQERPGDAARMRPWLYTVARRIAIDGARARQARPTEVVPPDLDGYAEEHDDIERALVGVTMRRGLMSLSPAHRRVLIETYYRGQSIRQAAQILGIPEGTVKSRMFNALRALASATGADQPTR